MPEIGAPIIIVGCRRSGTTMLQTILNGHSELLVHPGEPQYILGLYQRFGNSIRKASAALAYLRSQPYLPPDLDLDSLRSVCGDSQEISLRELVHSYLQVWGGKRLRGRHVVLKHPFLIFFLDLVYDWFPDARVVHVVRDPRANVSSQRARWPGTSVWESAVWWRNAARAGRAWVHRRESYTEVQYEHVIRAPEETLGQLCQALDISFSPGLLSFELQTMSYAPGSPPERVSFRSLDPSRLSLWKERLAPIEVRLIETCCRREMAWWDYESISPRVPAGRFIVRYLWERLRYVVLIAVRGIKGAGRRIGWRFGWADSSK